MLSRLLSYFTSPTTPTVRPERRQPVAATQVPAAEEDQFIATGASAASSSASSPQLSKEEQRYIEGAYMELLTLIERRQISEIPELLRKRHVEKYVEKFINRADQRSGMTPLHYAVRARTDNVEMVKLLIKNGADKSINRAGYRGRTPLHYAAWENAETVELLIEHGAGASINRVDIDGMTPLHCAADSGDVEVIKLLIEHGAGASINQVDQDEKPPIAYALSNANSLSAAQLLLEHGADFSLVPADFKVTHRARIDELRKTMIEALKQDGLSKAEKKDLLTQIGDMLNSGVKVNEDELDTLACHAKETRHRPMLLAATMAGASPNPLAEYIFNALERRQAKLTNQ